jgi:hypothetical protein
MDGELSRLVAAQRGFFLRAQALDCGYSPREISELLRSKAWVRIRHGAYAPADRLIGATPAARHLLVVRAAVAKLAGDVVVTHVSGLAALGVPLWGVDLSEVHLHRDAERSSRRDAGVVHHLGALPDSQVVEVDGLFVAIPERSSLDACRSVGFEAGVVLMDGARRLDQFDDDLAREILEEQRDWHGSVRASRVLAFSDPLAQTVGESRTRVLLARLGLPRPRLQHHVRDSDGRLLGITDLYIDEIVTAVEFDGRLKYGRALYERSGEPDQVDVGEVVWHEKVREDAIRDQGNEMVRIVWHELDGHDREVAGRFHRAGQRSRRGRRAG